MSGAFTIPTGHALNHAQHGAKATSGHSTATPHSAEKQTHPSDGQDNTASQPAAQGKPGPQQTAQADKSDGKKHDKNKHDKVFPALFHSMMQDGKAEQAAAMSQSLAGTDLKAAKGDDKADAKQNQDDAVAIAGLPLLAAAKGKDLPQLSWSGVVGVADDKGATAMALQGDQSKVVSSEAVNAKDLSNAVLKAQEQIAHTQLQQGTTPGSQNNQFSTALNKEHLSSLNMAHQFLADNASVPQAQTAAANSNAHNILAQDLNGLASAAATKSADSATQQINVPVQQPQWPQQLGDRVQWLIGQNVHQAAIHLNPPDLGALDVHILMHGDQASVNFSSPHAVVRHAVDAAIPRLREMMHETGLTLGDVNVSGQAMAQQQHSRDSHPQQRQQRGRIDAIGAVDESHAARTSRAIRYLSSNGMLDVYA